MEYIFFVKQKCMNKIQEYLPGVCVLFFLSIYLHELTNNSFIIFVFFLAEQTCVKHCMNFFIFKLTFLNNKTKVAGIPIWSL